MKKKFIFKVDTLTVLADLTPVTLTVDPVIPKLIGFLCYPGWIVDQV